MAYFSGLVLLWLACLAEEMVELEPVRADAPNFHCNLKVVQQECSRTAFCHWNASANSNAGACIDDPCLKANYRVLGSDTDTCDMAGTVTCGRVTSTSVLNHDCTSATPDTGILCLSSSQGDKTPYIDYCAYAYIRDAKCPDSICATNNSVVGCVPSSDPSTSILFGCQLLNEADCALVPKCYFRNGCQADPCFEGSEGKNCESWPGADATNPVTLKDCVDFKPLKSGSTDIQIYCLHKNNTNPNICYFAGKNVTSASPNYDTDYTETYPTYNFGGSASYGGSGLPSSSKNPTCTGQLTGCEGTGDCYTTANKGGALAGLYCTDGTHGNAGSRLIIPSMLVFLIVSALSLFNL